MSENDLKCQQHVDRQHRVVHWLLFFPPAHVWLYSDTYCAFCPVRVAPNLEVVSSSTLLGVVATGGFLTALKVRAVCGTIAQKAVTCISILIKRLTKPGERKMCLGFLRSRFHKLAVER